MGRKRCERCDVELQGNSHLCVACFKAVIRPCPVCTMETAAGPRVKRDGRGGPPVDCKRCGNRRYLMDWPPKPAAPAGPF